MTNFPQKNYNFFENNLIGNDAVAQKCCKLANRGFNSIRSLKPVFAAKRRRAPIVPTGDLTPRINSSLYLLNQSFWKSDWVVWVISAELSNFQIGWKVFIRIVVRHAFIGSAPHPQTFKKVIKIKYCNGSFKSGAEQIIQVSKICKLAVKSRYLENEVFWFCMTSMRFSYLASS